jgi:hypothetical protein
MSEHQQRSFACYWGLDIFSQFGPYGVGIDVQAAIALDRLAKIEIDPLALHGMDRALRDCIQRASETLNTRIRDGFRWNGRQLALANDGRAELRKRRLRHWLEKRFSQLRDRHERPFCQPRERVSRNSLDISLSTANWGYFLDCDPDLRTWGELMEAVALQRFLRDLLNACGSQQVPSFCATYRLIPTTRHEQNLTFLSKLAPGALRPPEGHSWLRGRLMDLDLRCFVAVLEKRRDARYPVRISSSQLGDLLRDHNGLENGNENSLVRGRIAELLAEKLTLPLEPEGWQRLGETLTFGLTRWLHPTHVRVLIKEELGNSFADQQIAAAEHAFLELFPEVEQLFADIVVPDAPLLASGEIISYGFLTRRAECLAGRVGMTGVGSQAFVHEFLELADAIMKRVIFEFSTSKVCRPIGLF